MKVLHFYKSSYPDSVGGTEQVINQIARGCQKLGVSVEVLSLTSKSVPRTTEIDGYLLHRARLDGQIASSGFSASALFRFAELAKKVDVVHYHFPWPFMDVVHFATRVKKTTVVTYHSDIIRQKRLIKIYRPLQYKFLGNVNSIVATSPNYLASSDVLDKFKNKVSIIPIGLDKDTYPIPEPAKLKYWLDRFGRRFFLFVGVIRYYKGLHILIEAAKGTEYPIIIVGAGPIEKDLKAQIEQLGVRNIHLLGFLSNEDKVALISLCLAVVFPSHLRSEAFGVSLLEGAMYGKPLISSEIGTGTTFINIQDVTGLVVPPDDPSSLRQAMKYLWEHPEQAAEMGLRAESRYWEHFTAAKMAKSYTDLYGDLVNQFKVDKEK